MCFSQGVMSYLSRQGFVLLYIGKVHWDERVTGFVCPCSVVLVNELEMGIWSGCVVLGRAIYFFFMDNGSQRQGRGVCGGKVL